jgi:hypothetical protein
MSNLSGYGINLGTDILEILKSFYLSKLSINSESPEEQPEISPTQTNPIKKPLKDTISPFRFFRG